MWSFFIKRRPITWLLVIGILLTGTFALNTIPREIQPEINVPFASVITALPGANPSDTESLITKVLEKEIANVDNIESINSTSGLGTSAITIEFSANVDLDQSLQELKDAVGLAKIDLPEDATEPRVAKAQADSSAVVNFSVLGNRPLYELTEIAEDIQEEVEKVSGIKSAEVLGGQKKRIEILIDPEKAEAHNLEINQIAQLIKSQNNNLPVGVIKLDELNYSVRIDNQFKSIEEVRQLPLFRSQDESGSIIQLSDIAKVEENYPESSVISKFSVKGEESKQSVTIQVKKKDGSNVIAVVDAAKAKMEDIQKQLPPGVEIAVSSDNSVFIRQDLGILTRSGIQTTILIILILFLSLGLREGLIAGLSIPLSLLATIPFLEAQGMSLNGLSLFALVIALGLMVDTAIVIMEGIHDNIKKGMNSLDAALASVETFKWPLIAGTLTTIFAFFPMLLVGGIVGQFMRTLPITISAALLCSLFISLTIGPCLSAKFLKNAKIAEKQSILEPFFKKLGQYFEKLTEKIVTSRKARVSIILSAIILFAGSLSLPASGKLGVEMFPKIDIQFFLVNVETSTGSSIETTEKAAALVEEKLKKIPELENYLTLVGTAQGQIETDVIAASGSTSSNKANFTVNLVPAEERNRKSYVIAEELRQELKEIKEAKVTINELNAGPPSDAPVVLRITGQEVSVMKEISKDLEEMLEGIPGTQNIRSSFSAGLSEFKFVLNRNKVNYYGLSTAQVNAVIRNAIQGIEITDITLNNEDIKIIARYDFPVKNNTTNISISTIKNIKIPTPTGESIKLSQLADFDLVEGISSISREDQERIIKVRSDLKKDVLATTINTAMEEKLENYEIPLGYNIEFGGDTQDVDESFRDLFRSMIIGIILIAFTLVLIFNSLKQPFIILLTLPLALIGVFPGLMAVGQKLSFPAFLGVVALSGIVVNDAIVLIDRINVNRRNGLKFQNAIAEAANSRLQPIVITSITTIFGIIPLALTNEFWSGLGFSLIFGLATATFLTLIVVPVLYYIFEAKKAKKAN